MKKTLLLFLSTCFLINCQSEFPTTFSKSALEDTLLQLSGEPISFESILDKNSGSYVLIDIWASWCKDCRKGLPKLQELQKKYPNMAYVFLSLDKSINAWKKGIESYNIVGEHYFMSSGWEGPLGQFLNLDWIPRYMIIDPNGKILVFRAIKTTNKNLIKHLK